MYDLTGSERANKSALLLVHERYSTQLAPFVKNSKSRYSYVKNDLEKIVDDVCKTTGADKFWVLERFGDYITAALEPVLVDPGDVKHEELTNPSKDEPYAKNLSPNSQEGREGIVEADPLDRGEVAGAGREEALEPDARVDLSQETAPEGGATEVEHKPVTSCFRCGDSLEKTASLSPVCAKCNSELLKIAYPDSISDDSTGWGAAAPAPGVQEDPAGNPNLPYTCTVCGAEGSREEIASHIARDHADVLQRQQEQADQNMGQDNNGVLDLQSQGKIANPYTDVGLISGGILAGRVMVDQALALYRKLRNQGADPQTAAVETARQPSIYTDARLENDELTTQLIQYLVSQGEQPTPHLNKKADVPRADDAAQVDPLPENPGDRFDEYVQRLAETAAARHFSSLTDEDIHSIASQVGANPDEVRNSIICAAVFGDNVAVNGQLGGDPSPPEGYEEISAQGLSGQQPTHDAVVPTDLIIQTVANDMNMSSDLAYNMVRDKYGADLPDKYHASISGQVHYYLPSGLAGNQPPQQAETGPAAPPAPQVQQAPQQQQPTM